MRAADAHLFGGGAAALLEVHEPHAACAETAAILAAERRRGSPLGRVPPAATAGLGVGLHHTSAAARARRPLADSNRWPFYLGAQSAAAETSWTRVYVSTRVCGTVLL